MEKNELIKALSKQGQYWYVYLPYGSWLGKGFRVLHKHVPSGENELHKVVDEMFPNIFLDEKEANSFLATLNGYKHNLFDSNK